MITEPTYINVREFGRKIQQAFGQAVEIAISENSIRYMPGETVKTTAKATFFLSDGSEVVYMDAYNELWHYPINGDPVWFVVKRPYAPDDTL